MYHYVKDKEFLTQSYSLCADLVNQLVQELKKYEINARMTCVGSKKRGLIAQNEQEPIDYDFNLWIESQGEYSNGKELKNSIIDAFNYVLDKNGKEDCTCKDSKSVITTGLMQLKKGNKTKFSIDLCIVAEMNGKWCRLIHEKTGCIQSDRWYWNIGPDGNDVRQKETDLKPEHWEEVRDRYLKIKNRYLKNNDNTHPSFTCYIEAINEIHHKYYRNGNTYINWQGNIYSSLF